MSKKQTKHTPKSQSALFTHIVRNTFRVFVIAVIITCAAVVKFGTQKVDAQITSESKEAATKDIPDALAKISEFFMSIDKASELIQKELEKDEPEFRTEIGKIAEIKIEKLCEAIGNLDTPSVTNLSNVVNIRSLLSENPEIRMAAVAELEKAIADMKSQIVKGKANVELLEEKSNQARNLAIKTNELSAHLTIIMGLPKGEIVFDAWWDFLHAPGMLGSIVTATDAKRAMIQKSIIKVETVLQNLEGNIATFKQLHTQSEQLLKSLKDEKEKIEAYAELMKKGIAEYHASVADFNRRKAEFEAGSVFKGCPNGHPADQCTHTDIKKKWVEQRNHLARVLNGNIGQLNGTVGQIKLHQAEYDQKVDDFQKRVARLPDEQKKIAEQWIDSFRSISKLFE